jgi:hypothetical protein
MWFLYKIRISLFNWEKMTQNLRNRDINKDDDANNTILLRHILTLED